MLESYEAYADASRVMEFMEGLLRKVCRDVNGAETFESGGSTMDLSRPFKKIAYLDAVSEALNFKVTGQTDSAALRSAVTAKIPDAPAVAGWELLLEMAFDALVEPNLREPTFIVRYPRRMSPLAKACADDPELADRFELYVGGREIANAYSEQNDPVEQLARFREQSGGDDEKIDWDFVEALAYGMPPAGGLGVGLDRLFMLLCDLPSIRDAILFPLLKPERSSQTPR